MTLQEAEMLTRASQARTSLLIKVAQVLAPRRMEWWVGTPVAQWLRRLAQRITR